MTLSPNFDICKTVFKFFTKEVYDQVDFTNSYYGSDHPSGSRILFVNGKLCSFIFKVMFLPVLAGPGFSVLDCLPIKRGQCLKSPRGQNFFSRFFLSTPSS